MIRSDTENGEQGASAIRTIAPGLGSWWAAMTASASAMIASWSWTTDAGGRPPCSTERVMDPRVATNRIPTSRAARTCASTKPGRGWT